MVQTIEHYYKVLIGFFSSFQSLFLLIIRLYWGWQFFVTGKGKLMNIENVAGFFASLGIPQPMINAYMAGTTECLGGLLLLLGLGARAACVPLVTVMCVAYLTAHRDALLGVFSDPNTFVTQDPFLFLMAAVIVLLFGPGVFSIDWILKKNREQPVR